MPHELYATEKERHTCFEKEPWRIDVYIWRIVVSVLEEMRMEKMEMQEKNAISSFFATKRPIRLNTKRKANFYIAAVTPYHYIFIPLAVCTNDQTTNDSLTTPLLAIDWRLPERTARKNAKRRITEIVRTHIETR